MSCLGAVARVEWGRPGYKCDACLSCSFDGDDFDDVEEDEGLEDLENAEEVGPPWAAALAGPGRLCLARRVASQPGWATVVVEEASVVAAAEQRRGSVSNRRDRRTWRFCPRESGSRQTRSGSRLPT